MKKHIHLQRAITIIFILLIILVILPIIKKIGLYDTAFALNDVVTEADCRMCHCYNVPDTHHQLVLSGAYECLNCHQIKLDDTTQTYYTEVIRDCVVCHGNVVGDTHHVLVQAGTYECLDCHQMTFDNASQQYIVELNFTCISGQSPNQPAIADAGLDQTVSAGQSVSFSGANSYDPDGSVVQYAWNFGDGSTGTGDTTSHTYNSSGIYTVTLNVTDGKGTISTDTVVITVNGVPGPVAVYADEVLRLDNLDSYTYRDSNADIYDITSAFSDNSYSNSYRIRYYGGDSEHRDNEAISMRINEEAGRYSQVIISIYVNSLEGSSESIRIYPYRTNANYLQTSYYLDKTVYGTGWVDIDVTSLISSMNGYGWMKFRIVNRSNWIYVSEGYFKLYGAAANESPIANAGSDKTVNAGNTVSFNGTGSSDPDGSIVNYQWNFGDGYTGSGSTTTHTYNTPGTYTVILTVTDNKGSTGTDTAIITVQAASVSASVYADQVLWIQNLKYDTYTDSYGSKTDITSRFKDNILTDTFTIYNHSDSYKVVSMKLNKDAGLYSQVSASIYVKALYNNSSQTIKIYPYKSDGNSINTSYYATFTISKTGWTQIDLTSLASKMKGFGWMKFRITCTSTSLDVAEGNFIVK